MYCVTKHNENIITANNGLIKVKTPLLEFVEHKKAEKLRSKEEKREERRRKEFERKKAREEEKRKKKEVKDQHRDMKRKEEHREDTSVKVRIVQYSARHCNWSNNVSFGTHQFVYSNLGF